MELEVLKEAITKVLSVYIKEIDEESTFEGDLGADSIDKCQIFKCVEDSLDIKIPEVDLDEIVTVSDALLLIRNSK